MNIEEKKADKEAESFCGIVMFSHKGRTIWS